MGLESWLRKYQDRFRDAGWRIKHINWLEDGKLEYYGNKPSALIFVILGLAAFFGGIWMISTQRVTAFQGICVSMGGLFLLFISRYVAGYFLYRHYVPVIAICLDRDLQEFEDVDPDGRSFTKKTFWSFRLLCEYYLDGHRRQVTPMAAKRFFSSARDIESYLGRLIDADGWCRLWVNPDNPLQTIFHKKPLVAIHS